MADPKEAAVFAAATLVLISIPAASQNVEIESKDSLSGEINSKFSDHFETDFETGKIFLREISSDHRYEKNESYDKTVTVFQTSRGYIEKTVTNNSIIKTIKTPYGTFKSGVKNGENISSFDGGNREEAEKLRADLEEKMSERAGKTQEKKRIVMSKILPDIELDVEQKQEIEHFNLTNNEDEEVDLEKWYILSEGTNKDTLNLERTISPGETLTFYSGEREEVNGAEDAIYDTGLTIYSNSGAVTLYNDNEKAVDTFEY